MASVSPIVIAASTGFLSGLLLSIPIGPINLTILNEGARRGFKWAALIGLGAVAMEVVYCFIAFTGFASFFRKGSIQIGMELSSIVFMLYLGFKFLLVKTVTARQPKGRFNLQIEEKFHPHSAFMTGFVRVMGNPGVLIFWIILAFNFGSRGWVDPSVEGARLACVVGVSGGTGLWFLGLSWAVSLGHKKFSEQTLVKMERGSGIGLLVIAIAHGIFIGWQMANHQL